MSSTTPTGSWRTKRRESRHGRQRSSRSASGASAIIARARIRVVFTSPRALREGLPICSVTSRGDRSESFSSSWQSARRARSAPGAASRPGLVRRPARHHRFDLRVAEKRAPRTVSPL